MGCGRAGLQQGEQEVRDPRPGQDGHRKLSENHAHFVQGANRMRRRQEEMLKRDRSRADLTVFARFVCRAASTGLSVRSLSLSVFARLKVRLLILIF